MTDIVKRYQKVRRDVERERNAIIERLRQINLLLRNIEAATRKQGTRTPVSREKVHSSVCSLA